MNKRITWNEYFMLVAQVCALRSFDTNTKVGACIVNSENKIVGTGYNGMPSFEGSELLPQNNTADNWLDTKYPYVVHAEMNAILNSTTVDLKNGSIYVTHYPCCDCAKAIIQSGIKNVYYIEDKHPEQDIFKAAKILLSKAQITCTKLEFTHEIKEIIADA